MLRSADSTRCSYALRALGVAPTRRPGAATGRHLLQHDGRLDVPQTEAAPLLPDRDPEEVGGSQGLAHLGRDVAGLVPLRRPEGWFHPN